jgi:hypothetical protein
MQREAVDPALIQRVRGDFHHAPLKPLLHHLGEVALQLKGAGCRVDGGQLPRADLIGDRAQQPHPMAGGFQHRADQVGRRRLAVGAGDPDHAKPARRISKKPGGKQWQGFLGILEKDDGTAHADANRLVHDHRRRPARRRLLKILMAVLLRAPGGDKHIAGPDLLGVTGDPVDHD